MLTKKTIEKIFKIAIENGYQRIGFPLIDFKYESGIIKAVMSENTNTVTLTINVIVLITSKEFIDSIAKHFIKKFIYWMDEGGYEEGPIVSLNVTDEFVGFGSIDKKNTILCHIDDMLYDGLLELGDKYNGIKVNVIIDTEKYKDCFGEVYITNKCYNFICDSISTTISIAIRDGTLEEFFKSIIE